jgi:hypothetical protein
MGFRKGLAEQLCIFLEILMLEGVLRSGKAKGTHDSFLGS